MDHVAITESREERSYILFSHFDHDAPAGLWKKKNIVVWDHIKINVYIENPFSVFLDGVLHYPTYGDVCILAPRKMHYGQITKNMHLNYYEFDIGCEAFSCAPGGDLLIRRLIEATAHTDAFLRPSAESRETVFRLCREIEDAVKKEEMLLAYAKVIEFLSLLHRLCLRPDRVQGTAFSLRTAKALAFIEKRYAQSITAAQIAEELGVSTSFLSRVFKRDLGLTLHEYLCHYRISKSLSLLSSHSVTETGYLCGFCDNSHFISTFKKHMGITPMQYKTRK
jgi:AraC-like DNA-binding protein